MLHPGLYEQVINNALTGELAGIPEARKAVAPIDKAEASKVLAQYLADVVQKGLDNVLDNGGDVSAQIELTNRIIGLIQNTTGRFVEFVRTVYGEDTLEENLRFIANALGGKGAPREVIRSYFLNDFYADHLKTYQKRPIYWLFDSGKKNGFKALVYMHRYRRDLLAQLRTDYVHEQQERYRTQLAQIGEAMDRAEATDRVRMAKQQKKLQEQAAELKAYEEKVHHLADRNIEIDLDDGVKHNYELFADVLAKIK